MERSVEGGQGRKIWALPEEMPGKGEKKRRGREGSRERPLHSLIMHLGREVERIGGRSPAPVENFRVSSIVDVEVLVDTLAG